MISSDPVTHGVFTILSLGANLGDPPLQLREGLGQIAGVIDIVGVSSLYRTSPVGYADQPDFFNLVCVGWTRWNPSEVLQRIQEIERSMGRERSFPNAPRVIDIDLIAYGDRVIETQDLIVPHPRMHQRGFVLVPLAEIAPDWRHPIIGRTAGDLASEGDWHERVERLGPLEA